MYKDLPPGKYVDVRRKSDQKVFTNLSGYDPDMYEVIKEYGEEIILPSAGGGIPPPSGDDQVFRPGYESEYWKERKAFVGGLDVTPPTEEEEEDIRTKIATQMQSQIDAIVDMYGGLIATEEKAGERMLGRARAVSARGGLGGTGMAEAGAEEARKYTTERVKALASERELKRAAVLDEINRRAEEKIKYETEKAMWSQEKRLEYLKDVEVKAQEDMAGLAETGTTLDLLKANKEVYEQLLEESGYSEFQFDLIYNSKLAQARKIDYQYSWRGDNLVAIGQDPFTGEQVFHTYSASELGIPEKARDWETDFTINKSTGEVIMTWFDPNTKESGVEVVGKVGVEEKEVDLLSVSEAKALGVPYGTTRQKAIEMGKVPGAVKPGEVPSNFWTEIDQARTQLQKGVDWGDVWNRIKSQFPNVPNETIDTALGGGIRMVSKETPSGFMSVKEPWGWAKKGAYEEFKKKGKVEPTLSKWQQEGIVWQWLETDEAKALSDEEKASQIRAFGLNPETFGIY